ncbi:hypothetical protein BH11MYX1_BH11MYX1_29230 [soil metagenome]
MQRRDLGLLLVGLLAVVPARVYADDVKSADDKFSAASKLREEGNNDAACAMFSESLALNPNAIGTILNVARCAEEAHRVATAIRYFSDAQSRAREQGLGPQLAAAEEHLAKLTPRATHLASASTETRTTDAKVVVQDRVVELAATGDVLVDAGPVKIVVSEPGRVSYTTTVMLGEAAHRAVAVPALGYPVTVRNTRRTVGKIMVDVAGVKIATSVIVGAIGHARWSNATKGCDSEAGVPSCYPMAYDRAQSGITLGNVGTGLAVASGVIVVAGAALWFLSPNPTPREHSIALAPLLSPTEAGLSAITRF